MGRVKGGVTALFRGGIRCDADRWGDGVGPPNKYPGGVDPRGVEDGMDE